MVFRLAFFLSAFIFISGLSASEIVPVHDELIDQQHEGVFEKITGKMAELGYHPSDAPDAMQEDWKLASCAEYKWFFKPSVVSEVPYVLIAVEDGSKLNMLAQVELLADVRPGILTYREEMANIARNLKTISRDLKRS